MVSPSASSPGGMVAPMCHFSHISYILVICLQVNLEVDPPADSRFTRRKRDDTFSFCVFFLTNFLILHEKRLI